MFGRAENVTGIKKVSHRVKERTVHALDDPPPLKKLLLLLKKNSTSGYKPFTVTFNTLTS